MAKLLYRLGLWCAQRARVVIVAWAMLLAMAGAGFAVGYAGLVTAFEIPETPSARVVSQLEKGLPEFAGASGSIVFRTENGSALSSAQQGAIVAIAADLESFPDVASVVDPFAAEQQRAAALDQLTGTGTETSGLPNLSDLQPELLQQMAELVDLAASIRMVSADGASAIVQVSFTKLRLDLPPSSKQAVVDYVEAHPVEGLEVGMSAEIAQQTPMIFGINEVIGLLIALIVLGVLLRGAITASLPLVSALTGAAVAILGSLALSSQITMTVFTPALGAMLGLAVGIDYSLFIVNRHRRQLLAGMDRRESIGLANGTSGNAVVFAGSTVMVALLALNVVGISILSVMGTIAAISVAVAVIVGVTLTPALLEVAGSRVLTKSERQALASGPQAPASDKVKEIARWRAVATVVIVIPALLAIAIPSMSMRLGLPDGSAEPLDSLAHRGYAITQEEFGPGANSPLLVIAPLPSLLNPLARQLVQVEVAKAIAAVEGVDGVAPVGFSQDGSFAAFQVQPAGGPDSDVTKNVVRQLRDLAPLEDGSTLGVAGQAAINIDLSQRLRDVLVPYLVIVVGLSLVIMLIVFRSLLVPLIATGGFVLSLLAAYGAVVAIFQWGWLPWLSGAQIPGPILNFLPIMMAGILFGLAMDYQLFIATGMREAFAHCQPARLAVVQGLRAGRAVVSAAGLIMASVFGGFAFSHSVMIRPVAFALAVGVLLDAFVVRLTLMPALMHLIGTKAWWLPSWLDRILPNVDVEGTKLEHDQM